MSLGLVLGWAFLHTPSVSLTRFPVNQHPSPKMNWTGVAVFLIVVIAYFWWLSAVTLRNVRGNNENRALYRDSLEVAKDTNRLRSEEAALLREAYRRASRGSSSTSIAAGLGETFKLTHYRNTKAWPWSEATQACRSKSTWGRLDVEGQIPCA